jgi:type IV secretion system protein VirD4
MVSRQETARPLLTPGEVMQLPPDDEVVMVSGHPPIKAQKIRYYLDANFKTRIQTPPLLLPGRYVDAPAPRPDDWTGLAIPAAPIPSLVFPAHGEAIDDGGHQPQPELAEVAFMPEPDHAVDDLGLLDDDDLPQLLPTQLDPRLQRTARLAALDPDDGIAL